MANDNSVNFIINVTGNAETNVAGITRAVEQGTSHINSFTSNIQKIRDVGLAFEAVNNAVGRLTGALSSTVEMYKAQSVVEMQLANTIRNTIGATDEQIESIKRLASEQQKLGVIGDEVQLSGVKSLSLYAKSYDSIQKLMPAINDLMVNENGLNVTQQSAASAAEMVGKALQGQTMMLERSGFKFTDAQKKILSFGNETQRAAILAQVIESKVGGMNQALAATPEGSMKQAANNIGDLQERIGKLWLEIQSRFMPVVEKLMSVAEVVIRFIEGNKEVFTSLAIVIGIVIAAIKGWIIVQGILNVVMSLNPVGVIVVGVIALSAAIGYLAVKIKGWGKLWAATVSFMKNISLAFVESIKLYFGTMADGIIIAIDKIKLGWYKFKQAMGIGNSNENQKMIAQINDDVEKRKKAITDGAKKVADYSQKSLDLYKEVNLSWNNSATTKSLADKLKAGLGISDNTKVTNNNLTQDLSSSSNSISEGGKSVKNFNIVINDGLIKHVDNHFASTNESPQSAGDFMWQLSQALQMILNDVNYAAG
ncbi:MAG: hypothetical protein LBT04_02055 [Prevotellaceae bacterium]|jgi:hypothetical protein|nr:hypothetical protein [Prevotellaceae bacterium]